MREKQTQSKTPLLFLCHRIPYPPNKGDKIRSFHLLHHLSQHFDIYLATFVDDPADWPYTSEVEKYCRDCLFVEKKRWQPLFRGLTGLLTGEALSVPFYSSRKVQDWVTETVNDYQIEHVIVYSSSMAQFVLHSGFSFRRKIIDFVDIDSDKWQQYAGQKSWPMNWLYRREARCLLAYEKVLARHFDAGLFVSSAEADMFRSLSPETSDKIGFYNNGVNTDYFTPAIEHANPYPLNIRAVVFTGAMDYWPNVDAVVWFSQKVLPDLLAIFPQLRFYIVGGSPGKVVQRLADNPGIVVTGRVEDIRPYMHHAALAVAPMRVARGVQNKVLEAMAMEKSVIVSSKGLEGIDARHGVQLLIADAAADYISLVEQLLHGAFPDIGSRARGHVIDSFDWDENLPEVVLLLGQGENLSGHCEVANCG